MSAAPPPLEDGWHATTPAGDSITRDFLDSTAAYLTSIGRAVGAAVVDDGDIAGAHHGAPFPFVNMVVARSPIPDAAWPDRLARIRASFPAGQPFVLTSPFPTPDLSADGFTLLGHPPFMVRPAGLPVDRPTPIGLEIMPVADTKTLASFERTLVDAYPAGPSGSMFHREILDVPGVALWLATLDGNPVATAATHHAGLVNGVEMVSCRSEVRGRGIGAAITWSATLTEPAAPAALIASDSGKPVYARMGYLPITRFTLWVGA
jgi:hypothetical protein